MAFSCLIRVDYHHAIGSGHAQRCLALASELVRRGWQVDFLGFIASPDFVEKLAGLGLGHVKMPLLPLERDLAETRGRVSEYSVTLVDGYQFDAGYFTALHRASRCLAIVDDQGLLDFYDGDFVINQNPVAPELTYATSAKTRCLLGLDYALLREEFIEARSLPAPKIRYDFLVTMGGSDPDNACEKILHAFERSPLAASRIVVVAGALNSHFETLGIQAAQSRHQITVLHHSNHMSQLMREAKMAITAAGSTCWELCCLGVPFITVVLAENQRPNAESLHQNGIAPTLGMMPDINETILTDAINQQLNAGELGWNLVDGLGASRIAKALETFFRS